MPKRIALLFAVLTAIGCATARESGPIVADTLCGIARAQMERCDTGRDLDRNRCRAASDAVIVCSIGNPPSSERSLFASPLRPGVGLTPRSLQTCWRETVGGPAKFGTGRLDVDPWTVAGMPGGGQGGLPCQRAEVNEAYLLAFGQNCIGPGAPLGGYCGGVSNEILRGVTPKLKWACENRPDLLGSEGMATWNCEPGGLDLLRLAAHVGGVQMLAAIDLAMGNGPPPPVCGNFIKEFGETCATCPRDVPGCPWCGNGRPDAGETCATCPIDLGACPPAPDGKADCSKLVLPSPGAPQRVEVLPNVASTGANERGVVTVECRGATTLPTTPVCIPAAQKAAACACGGLRAPRKGACLSLCEWANTLPICL